MRTAPRAVSSMVRAFLAVTIIGTAATHTQAQIANIPYGSKPYQLLDWYPPYAAGGIPVQNAPWVLYVHGSGASKAGVADVGQLPLAELFRLNGFAVFAFNWPNYGSAIYPAQLDDAVQVTQFLRANAAVYGIVGDEMVLWGHSAGATIGGWLVFGEDHQQPGGTLQAQQSTRPRAFLNWRGLMNFSVMTPNFPATGFGASTLSQLPPAFLSQVSPAFLVGSVSRSYTPAVASYYSTGFSALPLMNPHDPWFMHNLHATLAVADPAVAAKSIKIQNAAFPSVDPVQMEQMTLWSMKQIGNTGTLNLGHAIKGKTGFPWLHVSGDTAPGGSVTLHMQASLKSSTPLLMLVGTKRKDVPFLGGSLVTDPLSLIPLGTDAAGALTLPVTIPVGVAGTAYLQFVHADSKAVFGVAASNGVRVDYGK